MPQVKSSVPETLRPYRFHGVDFNFREGADHVEGTCPFCSKEGKFRISVKTGLWDCKVCRTGTENGGGNVYTFLRHLYDSSLRSYSEGLERLAKDRGVQVETLMAWGVVISPLLDVPLVPGHNPDGKLNNLYKYDIFPGDQKKSLRSTPGCHHQLFGVPLYDPKKPNVWTFEGPWDGMAAWEVLRNAKPGEGAELVLASEASSLYSKTNVLATPGANVFAEVWHPLFKGKAVSFFFDNDYPLPKPNKPNEKFPPVGTEGMKRACAILSKAEEKPESLSYLNWGPEGYDLSLPDGFDTRDALAGSTLKERIGYLAALLGRVQPIPQEWLGEASATKGKIGELELMPCKDWSTLVMAWRKAMKWTEGLDRALSCMFASVISTKAVGDQLWFKIIGPASCGKSTLCEALSVNKKYVAAKSHIRGFHSGYRSDSAGTEDNSLVEQLYDKTLITKDGDTLLQSPNIGAILAEARDLYDRTTRTHYRNGMGKDREGINMTWLLCGTNSLRALDSSELGERFLDCTIMEGIDEELEDEILWRVANRAERSLSYEANGKSESNSEPDLVNAMRLTGGYVSYLRENARDLLTNVQMGDEALKTCMRLGKLVAFMRARPSTKQDESAEREFAARLVSQMVRLAKCMAAVLNVKTVNEEVLRRVRKVAMDTARGRTLTIVKNLYKAGTTGMETKTLALYTHQTEDGERKLLRFLRQIGAVELFAPEPVRGVKGAARWRLSERMALLYGSVME